MRKTYCVRGKGKGLSEVQIGREGGMGSPSNDRATRGKAHDSSFDGGGVYGRLVLLKIIRNVLSEKVSQTLSFSVFVPSR